MNRALQRIARGTGIVFAGTVISMALGFLTRALIARSLDRSHYGVFSLTLTVLNIGLTFALLGLANGLPRELSRYYKKEPERIPELVSTALILVAISSFMIGAVTVFTAPFISGILNEALLPPALRLAAVSIPFIGLSRVFISVSRGAGRVRENVYYQNIVVPSIFLILTVIAVLTDRGLTGILLAYVISQAAGFLILTFETLRLKFLPKRPVFRGGLAKELLLFSFPLMLTGILGYIMNWTDTLMIGYYYDSDTVGLYNAAAPVARLLPIFLNSAGFLYVPIATVFFARNQLEEMKRIYQIMTRWIFLLTFPLFLFMFAFPEVMIATFFGTKYVGAATALRILAAGFMFHTFLGLNGMSLTVIGETNANLVGNFFAAVANIGLNIVLIPLYGINGAAAATAVSFIVANVFRSGWLYRKTGIHPFSVSYVKQIMAASAVLGLLLIAETPSSGIWGVLVVLSLSFAFYLVLLLVMKSVEMEDIELLEAVGKKFGVNLDRVIKLLARFI
ncbi:flippase [Thermococcus sp. M36]|uniref:flippase n=1 Tax=Thermococcus sp. M36 TaxID=1638261 RepID=UPI003183A5B6